MKHFRVFYCSNDHMIYGEDQPDICKECGSMNFTAIHGIQVALEEGDGVSGESEHYNSQE